MMVQTDPRLMLKQAAVKERMAAHELTTIQDDFYLIIKEFLQHLEGEDKTAMESLFNSFVYSRKAKIVRLAENLNEDPKIKDKMAQEEQTYFDAIVAATLEFNKKVL